MAFTKQTLFLAALSLVAIEAFANETPPVATNVVFPQYPNEAKRREKEGWVYLSMHISAEGDVVSAKVVRSYPTAIFDEAALVAAKRTKYKPRFVDGVATEEPDFKSAITFFIPEHRGIRSRYQDDFSNALTALSKRDVAASEQYVGQLRQLYEDEKLGLSELARYFQCEAYLASDKQDYVRVSEFIALALSMSPQLESRDVVDDLHLQQIIAFVGINQFHNAVDYYDSWRKVSSSPVPQSASEAIEKMRKAGYGRGREFRIAKFRSN
jgi:TonB family protein